MREEKLLSWLRSINSTILRMKEWPTNQAFGEDLQAIKLP